MVNAFILDGYTQDAYIKPLEFMYPEVRFKFRPILSEDRAEFIKRVNNEKDPKKAERIAGKLLSDHLVEWSLGDDTSPSMVMRLRPALFIRMTRIILYVEDVGDTDPDKTIDEKFEADETAEFSASKLDADSKN